MLSDEQRKQIKEIIQQQISEAEKELKVLKELTAAGTNLQLLSCYRYDRLPMPAICILNRYRGYP